MTRIDMIRSWICLWDSSNSHYPPQLWIGGRKGQWLMCVIRDHVDHVGHSQPLLHWRHWNTSTLRHWNTYPLRIYWIVPLRMGIMDAMGGQCLKHSNMSSRMDWRVNRTILIKRNRDNVGIIANWIALQSVGINQWSLIMGMNWRRQWKWILSQWP